MLDLGADVNARRRDGTTQVAYAASVGHFRTVCLLLERGADPLLRSDLGVDVVGGIFGVAFPPGPGVSKWRDEAIRMLRVRHIEARQDIVDRAMIRNFAEASGQEPAMWLKGNMREPNPEWVRANPEQAERWYQAVLKKTAPKFTSQEEPKL